MLKTFAIAALAAALLASGAYAPQAISADTVNVTVIEKNTAWPLPEQLVHLCELSACQND